jgi:predicted ATPase/class 3 adenylate cyclase
MSLAGAPQRRSREPGLRPVYVAGFRGDTVAGAAGVGGTPMPERALVFTDVVESTQLVARLGDARAADVWSAHDRRARALVARLGGREIDRTDGFFLLFERARDAARFAVDYHDAIADLGLAARVGIHVGPVALRQNAAEDVARGAKPLDVEGVAKPLAARVMSLARGGQTLITAAVREALANTIPDGVEVRCHGHFRLQGIAEPIEIFELGLRDRSPLLPPADADKAYRVVRAGDLWLPVREVRHNLPAERDLFVGRGAELRALATRFDHGSRLVTLLGPGGTGKTRLARRYGAGWMGEWPGGVCFCDLSEARTLDGIHFAVASALDVPLSREDPAVQLGHAIAGRGRCLIIVDNFEQVVEHAAATVGRWLDRAAQASFLVTSRERLHLSGEVTFAVEPLPVEEDAIQLFAERARAQRADFVLTGANRGAVAEVVRLLDGLPLAIELAAARVGVLSPAQLVERMRDRFALIAGGRGVMARQATLRGAIDWSWELLAPWEQAAFAQCSTFDGGFVLDAAEAVVDLSAWSDAPPVMDVIGALADKSLLRTWVPAEQGRYDIEEPYFGMYLSIHEYAAEKLVAAGQPARLSAQERHGRYFAGFGTDDALEALSRHGGVRRRRALALELDNLVAACDRAVIRGDHCVATAAYRAAWEVLALQGPFALAVTLGNRILARANGDDALRLAATATLAQALRRAGRMEDARLRLDEALGLARAARDERREGRLLVALGNHFREQAQAAQAHACFAGGLAIARRVGDRATEGRARSSVGLLRRAEGQTQEAREHFAAALAIARELGNRGEEGNVLGSLGLLASEGGEVEEARGDLEAALAVAREVGDLVLEGVVRANLAQLDTEQGRLGDARAHCEAALAIHRMVGNRRLEGIALGNLGPLAAHQGRITEAQACYEGALAIAREVGNRRHEGFLRASLGILRHGQARLQEARDDYDAALAIAREVGDRRGEGIVLSRLGLLHAEQGRPEEARRCFDRALSDAREAGYRRLEGVVLGGLGGLLAQSGCMDEGLARVRAGEAILREIADREELSKLLCVRGRIEAAAGQREGARAALAEAESVAEAMGCDPASDVCREIAMLRDVLA